MKTTTFFGKAGLYALCACMAGAACLATSCNDGGGEDYDGGRNASLAVTLCGESGASRAVLPSDDADGAKLKEAENKVNDVTVFVFNTNGTLDKRHSFAAAARTEIIEGLTAGAKRVVVTVNVPSAVTFPDDISYAWFSDASNVIDLDTQTSAADGLFMSGEANVTLRGGEQGTVEIPVSRLVAKVRLGGVTVSPEAGHDASKFELTGVMIMKARGSAMMGLPSAAYTRGVLYGGMAGGSSTAKGYLTEAISKADNAGRYFYVLPSDDDDGNTTLITLAGTYDGATVYFPFRINGTSETSGSGGDTTDGTFVERNHVYTVNVTIKRPGSGGTDPEVPADPASLSVTVQPQE